MPKYYAVAYSSGTSRIFSNWEECERAVKGRGDIRFKKFKSQGEAEAWGAALAKWLKNRKSTLEVLAIEDNFDRVINQHDPRLTPLPN